MEDEFVPVHLRIEGDVARGRQFIRAANQVRLNLLRVLEGDNVSQGAISRPLGDGVQAYVRKYGDLQVVTIVADPEDIQSNDSGLSKTLVPNFLSGTVFNPYIRGGSLGGFRPNQRTARIFNLSAATRPIERLAVEPHPTFSFELNPTGDPAVSQYVKLRPSLYSGTMKKLVQLLMGYGKLSDTLPVYQGLISERILIESQYQRDIGKSGLQIRYDWRSARTHGLHKAADGSWWLIQICSGFGVHAMPLPLFAMTKTPEYRQAAESAGDDDCLEVLDLFGGLPTGESFPAPSVIESYARAGVVLKGDTDGRLSEFSRHSYYSPWSGWAFNEIGTEAHQTAWRYDPDGFKVGIHWALSISIGGQRDKPTDVIASREALKRRIQNAVKNFPRFNGILPALLVKAEWASFDQIVEFQFLETEQQLEAWDAIEVEPISSSSMVFNEVGSARMLGGVGFVKFWEPSLGLISFDFRPSEDADYSNAPVEMDAVVHVFFKGNLLCPLKVWVRTNNGPNTVSEEEIGECSFDDYRNIITTSFDGKANGVYCNEVDERNISYELQSSAIKIGRINNTGSVTGFYDPSQPWVSFWTQIWELRQEWRFKTGGGAQVGSVAVVPLSSRESFYITYKKAKGGSSEGGFIQINPVGSAITYQAWENNIIWTGIARENCFEGGPSYPACWQLGDHPAGCGQTTPYVPIVWQQFGGTREYGPCEVGTQEWASPCTSMLSFPRYTGSASNTPLPSVNTLAESELVVTIVSSGIPENIVASREEQTGVAAWRYDEPWFQLSPSEDGLFQKIDSYGNELGEASTFVYYSTLDSGFDSVYGSPGGDEFKNGSWVNVGVVND